MYHFTFPIYSLSTPMLRQQNGKLLHPFWNNYPTLHAPAQRHLRTGLRLPIPNSTIDSGTGEVPHSRVLTSALISEISDLRNIGYQKVQVSEISGIRNIRIKFRLKYFIIYFYHYFFLTKPQYVFDFWSLDQSRSQNIRVLNLISATVYSRIPN